MHLALIAAVLIGIIAGLRAFMAPTAVSWAAKCALLTIPGPLAFLGYHWTAYIFTAFALFELVTDQLPSTPSRKVPPQFGARIVMGSLAGAAIGAGLDSMWAGLLCGAVGAVIGTLGGAWVRGAMAKAFGKDMPAALVEDLVAIAGAYLIVTHL
jgi:uncharacterized membrane protein